MTKGIQTWAIVWVKDEKDDIDGVCSSDGNQGFSDVLGRLELGMACQYEKGY